MPMYKSPGVSVREVDLSAYARMMSKSVIVGIVGGARSGPIGVEVPIETRTQFREIFGEAVDFSGIAADYVLQNSRSLRYVRAASDEAEYRELQVPGTVEDGDDESAVLVKSKYKGTLFDEEVTVSIEKYEGTIMDDEGEEVEAEGLYEVVIVIGENDDEPHLKTLASLDPEAPNFMGKIKDTYFEFVVTEGTTEIEDIEDQLTEGDDGTPDTEDLVKAIRVLEDPEQSDVQVIAVPGVTAGKVVNELLAVANTRKDCLALVDPPQGIDEEEAVEYFDGKLESHEIGKVNTSYAAAYHPWVKIYDPVKDASVWAPPSVAVLEAMSRLYAQKPIWTAPAGVSNLDLAIVSDVEMVHGLAERDTLYVKNINPICNYRGMGYTALGQKTSQRKPTAVDRINVRMLVNYIKRVTDYSTVGYLFLGIDETTMSSWVHEMDQTLGEIKQGGGVYDYKITMDWSTVTQDHLNNNIMPGAIQIKPTKVAEYIPIDLIIRNKDDVFA